MVEVSNGPQPVPVPNEQGRSKDDALHALAAFHVVVTQAYSDTVASGNVISQSPSSGTRPKGSTINVVVSKGPQLFAVPDVRGKSVDDAKQILTDAGFNYRIIQLPFGPGHVLLQSPGAGSMKPHGTTITLEVF
jgi:serine/threonine-protein kinase